MFCLKLGHFVLTLALGIVKFLHEVLFVFSEEVEQPLQSVLLTYLRIILTEWEEPYTERAGQVMSALTNENLIKDLFVSLLQSKVSGGRGSGALHPRSGEGFRGGYPQS